MILSYENFIKESLTREINSVYNFIKSVGDIDNAEQFKEELLQFCRHEDIPLSKLKGEYISIKSAIKKCKNNPNEEIGIFLFDLKSYISYINVNKGSSIEEKGSLLELSDFCIMVFIDKQTKGLSKLKKERDSRKEDSYLFKSDSEFKMDNLKRYKKSLDSKKVNKMVYQIINANLSKDNIVRSLSIIRSSVPSDFYSNLVNKLYDYKIINEYDYFGLINSRNSYDYYY